jgi:CHASE2 domain-containing sensor protein
MSNQISDNVPWFNKVEKVLAGLIMFAISYWGGHIIAPILEPIAYKYLSPSADTYNEDELPIVVSLGPLYGKDAANPNPENPISEEDFKQLFETLGELHNEGITPAAIGFDIDFSRQDNGLDANKYGIDEEAFLEQHVSAVEYAQQYKRISQLKADVFFAVGRHAFNPPSQWWGDPNQLTMFGNLTAPSALPYGNLENSVQVGGIVTHLPSLANRLATSYLSRKYHQNPQSKIHEALWTYESPALKPNVSRLEILVDYGVLPKIIKNTISVVKTSDGKVVFSPQDKQKINGKILIFGQTEQSIQDVIAMSNGTQPESILLARGVYGNAAIAYSIAYKRVSKLPKFPAFLGEVVVYLFTVWFVGRFCKVSKRKKKKKKSMIELVSLYSVMLAGLCSVAYFFWLFCHFCTHGILTWVAEAIALCLWFALVVEIGKGLKKDGDLNPMLIAAVLKFAVVGTSLFVCCLLLKLSTAYLHLGLFSVLLFILLEPLIEPIIESPIEFLMESIQRKWNSRKTS